MRTTSVAYITKGGIDVDAHHSTGGPSHLPTAFATARKDLDRLTTTIAQVEANISRQGISSSARKGWYVQWTPAQGGGLDGPYPTLRAALTRLGEVAIAKHAINPQTLRWTGREGCL